MKCRESCGACCIAPSISSPLPGMPQGKPAGTLCVNLSREHYHCLIWGTNQYPAVCAQFQPQEEVCGATRAEALQLIETLELLSS